MPARARADQGHEVAARGAVDPVIRGQRMLAEARLADALAFARQAAGERDTALARIAQLEQEIVHAAALRDVRVRHAQALASYLWRLQRLVGALLASRRWAMGRRVGDLIDRAMLRRRDLAEDERIELLMEDGRRLLNALGESAVELESARGRGAAAAVDVGNFQRFLCAAVTDPVLQTPLDAAGQHVLDVMTAYRDALVERWRDRRTGPLVSVIMPTFNREAVLPRAISSVLNQSYEHWQLVVVDDGSTDGTEALLRAYTDSRIVTVPLEGNNGVSHARNRGLEKASGDLIAYLDSDNYWDEHYLLLMVGALQEQPARDSIYCAQEIWEVDRGEADEPLRRLDAVRWAPFNRALLENRNYIDLNAFMHRRTLADGPVAFHESLPRLVDWELFLRLTAASRPLALPCRLSHYEFGTAKNQLTRTIPVRPATRLIDETTLQREVLDVTLPPPLAARYRNPALYAPLGGPRPAPRGRPVTVVVHSLVKGSQVALCLEAARSASSSAGADVRFLLPSVADVAAVRAAVTQAAHEDDVEIAAPASGGPSGLPGAIAAAASAERDVVLLAADAVATPGWLEAFWEVLDVVGDAGLVAPRVVVLPDSIPFAEHVPYAKAYRELDVTLSRKDGTVLDPCMDDDRGFVELSWARFTCAYLPRGSLVAAGPPALDPASPPGCTDRAARVYGDLLRLLAGRRIVYTPHAKVYHLPW